MSSAVVSRGLFVEMVERAALLPHGWDDQCGTTLRSRRMLTHFERFNPCRQRYYCLYQRGELAAGAIVYSRTQNLLTFLGNIPSPVLLNVVGIPASLSPAGVWGAPAMAASLLDAVFAREKGLTLVLNLPADFPGTAAHQTRLLPGMVFTNRYVDLEEYEQDLRASWRRRLKAIRQRFTDVETVREDCFAFTRRHHQLYLDVLAKAPEKMETLSFNFFRELPAPLELVSCYRGGELLCWRLILNENDQLRFLLGGHDYRLNGKYDAYFNNLLGVLADGMARGARRIDFGQTAEDAKARLGARPVPEKMLLHHSGPRRHRLVGWAAPLLAYRKSPPTYHVFRKEAVS